MHRKLLLNTSGIPGHACNWHIKLWKFSECHDNVKCRCQITRQHLLEQRSGNISGITSHLENVLNEQVIFLLFYLRDKSHCDSSELGVNIADQSAGETK